MNQKTSTQHPDRGHSKPVEHSDDQRSRMPERHDEARKQSPADKPGKKPGDGEPPVG
jgi:hypothetical protein